MRMLTALTATSVLCVTTTRPATARLAKIEETSPVVGDSDYAVRTAAMSTFALGRAARERSR